MPQPKPTTISELEDRLAGPDGHAIRKQLLEQVRDMEARLAAKSTELLPRDEFAQVKPLLDASRAAIVTLSKWMPGTARFHKTAS
jgi:hypothetical protein